MDNIDKQILSALQKNATIPLVWDFLKGKCCKNIAFSQVWQANTIKPIVFHYFFITDTFLMFCKISVWEFERSSTLFLLNILTLPFLPLFKSIKANFK